MGKIVEGVDSLANFKRQTAKYLKRLHNSGSPVVLTVNGKEEVVVQDADAYRRLVEIAARVEHEETVAAIQEGLDDIKAGRVKPARKAIARLAKKHGFKSREA